MVKSDLNIEPYTLNEALICINTELKKIKRREIKKRTLYDLIYNVVKIERLNKHKCAVLISYNSIVDIYNHITTKHYPKGVKRPRIK